MQAFSAPIPCIMLAKECYTSCQTAPNETFITFLPFMRTNRRPRFSPLLVADEGECKPGRDKEDCYEDGFIANKHPLGLIPQVVEFQELHVAM